MVALVIVSHSAALAEGVAQLAREMAGPEVRIELAAGLALPGRPLGTDAEQIARAIERAYSEDGVLVLMDLGSAILSAEMALEQIVPERRGRVVLCAGPIVEGAVAAAVQARLGSSLEQVATEARNALAPKIRDLGAGTSVALELAKAPAPARQEPAEEMRLTVGCALGLHARPAARIVRTLSRFDARVELRNATGGSQPVSAASINALLTLGAMHGHEVVASASGPQAANALAALRALAEDNFGDEAEAPPASQTAPVPRRAELGAAPTFQGIAGSPGIAVGRAVVLGAETPSISQHPTTDPAAEWKSLLGALEKTREQIEEIRCAVADESGSQTAAIFEAHLAFLEDESLREPARRAIFEQRLNAAAAWWRASEQVASGYRALDDPYLRARANDVLDVGRRVLRNLTGATGQLPGLAVSSGPAIIVAAELTAAEAATLDPARVLGICLAFGAPTSHGMVIAASLGIPAVVGVGEEVLRLPAETPLVIDGDSGKIWADPDPRFAAEAARRSEQSKLARKAAVKTGAMPAVTRDGRRIEVAANVSLAAEVAAAVAVGADGVGLFRTEFLFLNRTSAPDEEEQFAAYDSLAQAMAGRPVIIRTLDAGGDKPLPYLSLPRAANPFLGWRGIRISLARPELLRTQLRAILRVAGRAPVKLMFPMITTIAEWRAARGLAEQVRDEFRREGRPVPARIETGIMVETPAAAVAAAHFAREVDFVSIGTNDLAQYTMAAERGNPRVADLADACQPAVLWLIDRVTSALHARGKWAGVCGELAGDPAGLALLVGLDVDELSMSPPATAAAREIIRELRHDEARELALRAIELETANQVRELVRAWSSDRKLTALASRLGPVRPPSSG